MKLRPNPKTPVLSEQKLESTQALGPNVEPAPAWFKDEIEKFVRSGTPEYEKLRIYAVSLCGNSPDANDALQNTLIQALEHHRGFERGTNMEGWLFRIMKNTYLMRIRHEKMSREKANDVRLSTTSIPPNQEDILHLKQRHALVAKLSPEMREAINAVSDSGSYEAAAKRLGKSLEQVKHLLKDALELLPKTDDAGSAKSSPLRAKQSIDHHLSESDIERYLPQLPEDMRRVYTEVAVGRKSYKEVAHELGEAEGTIKSRLSRARKMLADLSGVTIDTSRSMDRLREWHQRDPRQFEKALEKLTPREREIVNLSIKENKSRSEIATQLGVGVTWITSAQSQSYKKLLYHFS